MRFPEDRARAVVARGMLRTILAAQLEVFPAGLGFRYAEKGKPSLGSVPGIRDDLLPSFSVSHSGDWVLIGVGGSGRVGVDIERMRPLRDLDRIAQRFFAPREFATLCETPEHARLRTFFGYWTVKEAYVKALGEGISHGFHTFSVCAGESGPPGIEEVDGSPDAGAGWTVWSGDPVDGYVAAVAMDVPGARVVPRIWTGAGEVEWG
jgi:4'-phosphopantetheinyl transferase